jgi:hypothetical protein
MLSNLTPKPVPTIPAAKKMDARRLALWMSFSTKLPRNAALIPKKKMARENAQSRPLAVIVAFSNALKIASFK